MSEQGVLVLYKYLDDVCHAIEKIKGRADFAGHEVFSPTSYHEIEHASGFSSSPVKWFTLIGGMTGTVSGFALALATDYDWPLVVGGKMAGIYSLPVDVIFGFELTILFGAIMTIAGILWMGRIPDPTKAILDNRLTDDHFGIFLPNIAEDSEQVALLQGFGAVETKLIGAD